mmetsp:Transcript_20587/g.20314  ORF Transcript_20587/g.20314 Transcript_20587/m.20314 type:complete len:487 (-) Transcript_20587:14-1474(-)
MTTYFWLNGLNIVFAIWSLFLQVIHLSAVSSAYTKVKMRYKSSKEGKSNYRRNLQKKRQSTLDNLPFEANTRINNSVTSFSSLNSLSSMGSIRQTEDSGSRIGSNMGKTTISSEYDESISLDWNSLTLSDRLKIYNPWTFFIIFGDVLLIIGSAFYIVNNDQPFQGNNHILGLSAFAHWASCLKYIEGAKDYNIIANTLVHSAMLVLKAVLGIFPVFIGFVLLGLCFFIDSNLFGSVSTIMYALFSLMNGDSPFVIWYDIAQHHFLFGSIYMYVFLLFSIIVIENVFIVLIGDAYVKSKYLQQTDWIKETDHLGNVIQEDEEAEDPLKPFYNKTQKEIESRKALVKMLQEDKEILMKEYYKDIQQEKLKRRSSKVEVEDSIEEEESSLNERLPLSTLGMTLLKYLTYLNEKFEDDINEKSSKFPFPELVKKEKEDIYDRYCNCYDRIQKEFKKFKKRKLGYQEKHKNLVKDIKKIQKIEEVKEEDY